jgi:RNA polymerase sigma-70 factor (ECF subfamily)
MDGGAQFEALLASSALVRTATPRPARRSACSGKILDALDRGSDEKTPFARWLEAQVGTEPEKKAWLLGALADRYEPTEADADRIFAKIQASLVAPPPTPQAPRGSGLGAGKNVVLVSALCALGVIGGGLVAWRFDDKPAAPARSESPTAAIANPSPTLEAPSVVGPSVPPVLPSMSVGALPSAHLARLPVASPRANAKPTELATGGSHALASETLEKEARLLAEARRAVARGDAARGLALLDEHAQTFPNGFFAGDRAAERIVVLCGLGRRDEAVRDAKVFLAGRPEGPLRRRVMMSCGGEP